MSPLDYVIPAISLSPFVHATLAYSSGHSYGYNILVKNVRYRNSTLYGEFFPRGYIYIYQSTHAAQSTVLYDLFLYSSRVVDRHFPKMLVLPSPENRRFEDELRLCASILKALHLGDTDIGPVNIKVTLAQGDHYL